MPSRSSSWLVILIHATIVARPQDAKPRVRRADDQICLGQRNDAALSKHANPQKTGRQPSALFSSQKLQAVKPFLVCC